MSLDRCNVLVRKCQSNKMKRQLRKMANNNLKWCIFFHSFALSHLKKKEQKKMNGKKAYDYSKFPQFKWSYEKWTHDIAHSYKWVDCLTICARKMCEIVDVAVPKSTMPTKNNIKGIKWNENYAFRRRKLFHVANRISSQKRWNVNISRW